MGLSASDLAGIQNAAAGFQTDTCTVEQTGATLQVKLTAENSSRQRLRGTPEFLHLHRFQLKFLNAADIQPGYAVDVTGKGIFLIIEVGNPNTISASNLGYAIQSGTKTIASVLRPPAALAVGATAAYATHLASLTLRPLSGMLLMPVSQSAVEDTFGVQVTNPARVIADWPAGNTEDVPVRPQDVIVLPNGNQYVVMGVQFSQPWLSIYVEIPIT